MNESKLIVVGYSGGYGGNFFAGILQKALMLSEEKAVALKNNEFSYRNDCLGLEKFALEAVFKAHELGLDSLEYSRMRSVSFDDHVYKKIYDINHDDDRSVFIKNIVNYYKNSLKLKPGLNIVNMHHFKKKEGFDIRMLHEDTTFFLLNAEDMKHQFMFKLLLDIKHDLFSRDKWFIQHQLDRLYDKPSYVKPFDSAIPIDVGEMFLELDADSSIAEVEKKLSETLGVKIILDKRLINDYSRSNIELLNKFLGIRVETSTYFQATRAAKTKLESLL